ncbi:hypothetical protein SUGI_0873050 [Cryptomeria japonica]|nr:hypothetical protein SUGI_0873050 [Cryptomeria japonica]
METKSLVSLISLASLSLIIMVCDPVNAANVFTVGDEKGWTIGFDYRTWVQAKEFHVGDRLVFNYPKGVHNVLAVNGSSFANCVKEATGGKFESGKDDLQIMKSGNIWVISGVGQDCENDLKLKITAIEAQFPSASPAPGPAPAPESSDWIGDSDEHWPTPAPSSRYRSKPW